MIKANAQTEISGTVYDSSKLYGVSDVLIRSSVSEAVSDSFGRYKIQVADRDSISFIYNNKPTIKFPVRKIENYNNFDISLKVKVQSKYRPLKEIVIFSKSYKEQQIENRVTYSKIFNAQKPGLKSTLNPNSPPGLDIGALVGLFQFRKNRQIRAFQNRLMAEEEEKYIDYRFNTNLLKRITHLQGDSLMIYKRVYRPDYESLLAADDLILYSYILRTASEFRKD